MACFTKFVCRIAAFACFVGRSIARRFKKKESLGASRNLTSLIASGGLCPCLCPAARSVSSYPDLSRESAWSYPDLSGEWVSSYHLSGKSQAASSAAFFPVADRSRHPDAAAPPAPGPAIQPVFPFAVERQAAAAVESVFVASVLGALDRSAAP